ncbi:MAG: biopolymer transporter ExbD [Burkholderiaceae bacterium]|nr:biopolymer transporter ExbD [Burkholderiaceae bacterium]
MRYRRLHREAAGLDVTAFINLIIVLVPFLLSVAVFSHLSVLEMSLPAQSSGALEKLSAEKLNLEIVIREEKIDVGDRIGGLIQSIPKTAGRRLRLCAAGGRDAHDQGALPREDGRHRAGRPRRAVRRAGAVDGRGARHHAGAGRQGGRGGAVS